MSLRLGLLEEFPAGIHSDEAWTGIRARDFLRGEDVDVYDHMHSVGQPSGSQYLLSLWFRLSGNESIFVLRFPSALALSLELLLFSLFCVKTLRDSRAVVLAILFYALGDTENILGRIAFPPVWVVMFENLALVLMASALEKRGILQKLFLILAGFAGSAGIYFWLPTRIY